jgi:hypothetical protein
MRQDEQATACGKLKGAGFSPGADGISQQIPGKQDATKISRGVYFFRLSG